MKGNDNEVTRLVSEDSQKSDQGKNPTKEVRPIRPINPIKPKQKGNTAFKSARLGKVMKGAAGGLVIGGIATGLMSMGNAKPASEPPVTGDPEKDPETSTDTSTDTSTTTETHPGSLETQGLIDDTIKVSTSVNEGMSFEEAFATARAEVGPGGCFAWHGVIYGTYTSDEWQNMSDEQRAEFNNHFNWNHINTDIVDPTEPQSPEADPEDGPVEADPEDGPVEADPEDGSPEADSEDGSPEADSEDGSPEADSEDGSPEADPEDGSPEADPEVGSSEADPEVGSSEADPEVGSPEADPEDGAQVAQPEEVAEVAQPEEVAEVAQPEEVAEVAQPEEVAEVAQPEEVAEVVTDEYLLTEEDDIMVVSVNNQQVNVNNLANNFIAQTETHKSYINQKGIETSDSGQEIEVLGVVHDDETGSNIGGVHIDGQDIILVDVDGDEKYDFIAVDKDGDGEIDTDEIISISDHDLTVDSDLTEGVNQDIINDAVNDIFESDDVLDLPDY